ncbi:MAG: TolC family protein [Bacteroidetes bacterium]|nr:TolC family protein [Bacteroidota bacterium]
MNFKISFLFFSLLLAESKSFAQETKKITLDDAISMSINNSKQLKLSQAKIEEATAKVQQAIEQKLPNMSISGSYLRLGNAQIDIKTNPNNNGGGGNNGNSGGAPKVSQALYGLANVSLPIYAGGKIKYGIESAKYLAEALKLDAQGNKDDVIQNTMEAFANLFKAHTAVLLMQENLHAANQRINDFGNLEKNGLLPRNDLLKAQLQASNIELSLLDAENNVQMANVNMNLMLGLPVSTQLVLDTTGIEKRDDGSRQLNDYLQLASKNRMDLASLSIRKKAAETGIQAAKAEKLPSLQLTGGYIAADIPKLLTITNAVNVGIGVSYNLSSLWKTKSKVQQAESVAKQMMINESILDDNITLQVNKAYLTLMSSRKKIEVTNAAVAQANENYRIVKNKFDNSLATATDLLDADAAQLQAKLSYTLAKADAFLAYNKLLQTSGILASTLNK